MKKYITILLSLICILSLTACGKNDTYEISFTVPAGSTDAFVYSDEEISPIGNQITISSGAGLSDTLVELEPIEAKEENAYDEPTYLTPGMPVKMEAEKGAWFKIGIDAGRNDSDADRVVTVKVKGVEVRTGDTGNSSAQDFADTAKVTFEATVLEAEDNYCLVEPVEGSMELSSADRVVVQMQNLDPSSQPEVGDIIEITYSGDIMETYPAQLGEIYSIKITQKADSDVSD